MPEEIDWERERSRAAQHTQRTLIALARRAGFEVSGERGKGSHVAATLPGIARPVVISQKLSRRSASGVINQLRRAMREQGRDA